MVGETNKVGEGYTPPSPDVQKALEMPLDQLEAQMKAAEVGNEVTPSNPGTQPVAETPAVPVQVGQVPQVETKQADTPTEVVEPPKVEDNKAAPTFAELQAKKGFKTPDDIAKSYAALEKEYHKVRQEQAAASRVHTQPQSTPTNPPQSESNFLNELLEKPEQTIASAFLKLNSIVNAEQVDKINTLQRKLTFEEMASNPKTADFADPTIQAQMQEEFKSRPDWMENVNAHIEDAYWMARGKIKAEAEIKAFEQGKIAGEQSIQAKKGAMVEGSSAVTPSKAQDTNPLTMPLSDLEQMLQNKLQGK